LELLADGEECSKADVFCFLYDASDANSFAYISSILSRFSSAFAKRPILIVATKSDCDLVPQKNPIQPDQFCRSHDLDPPLSINLRANRTADVFGLLLSQALHPSSLLQTPEAKERALRSKRLAIAGAVGASSAIVALAGILAYKLLKPKHQ
jgi:Ras family protein T1